MLVVFNAFLLKRNSFTLGHDLYITKILFRYSTVLFYLHIHYLVGMLRKPMEFGKFAPLRSFCIPPLDNYHKYLHRKKSEQTYVQ